MLIFPNKDPDEVLDYRVDWSARLGTDAIATSEWEFVEQAGLEKDSDTNTTTSTTVWLSGGTAGEVGVLLNRITTTGGRTLEETAALTIIGSEFPATPGYDLPTATFIRTAFPAFAAVPDLLINFWITRAARSVDTSWTEGDYTYAIALLTAHLMTANGLGTGAEIEGYRSAGITKLKSGTLDVTFADGTASDGGTGYGSTSYGRQFAVLLKQNRGGPRVITNATCDDGWGPLGIMNNGGIVPWAY